MAIGLRAIASFAIAAPLIQGLATVTGTGTLAAPLATISTGTGDVLALGTSGSSIVTSIEHETLSLTTGTTATQALSQGQDPDNCVPFYTVKVDSTAAEPFYSRTLVHVEVFDDSGTPTVRVTRGENGSSITVSVYAVEFAAGVVQKVAIAFAASDTSDVVACTAVDQAHAFILGSYYMGNTGERQDFDEAGLNFRFSADNQITAEREDGGAGGFDTTLTGTAYVIESAVDFDVQRFDLTMSTGSQTATDTITSVDAAATFVVGYSWSGVDNDACASNSVRVDLQDATTVRAFKSSAVAGDPKVGGFVVSMTGGSVQRGNVSFPSGGAGNASQAIAITTVDATLAIPRAPSITPAASASPSTATGWGDSEECAIRVLLTDVDEVTLDRDNSFGVAAEASWEVIEFPSGGALSVPLATLAGEGDVTAAATSTVTPPPATVTGTGEVTAAPVTGTGTLNPTAATTAGVADVLASGSATVSVPPATTNSTGDVLAAGSATLAPPAATIAGTGDVLTSGTGTVVPPSATVVGSSDVIAGGTGTLPAAPATLAGSADVQVTAASTVVAPSATVSGSGEVEFEGVEGTGTLSVPSATTTGSADVVVGAAGTLTAPSATVQGSAGIIVGGAGTLVPPAPSLQGFVTIAVSGVGTISVPLTTLLGLGDTTPDAFTYPLEPSADPGFLYPLEPSGAPAFVHATPISVAFTFPVEPSATVALTFEVAITPAFTYPLEDDDPETG